MSDGKILLGMERHPAVYMTIEQLSIRSIISIIYRPAKSNQPPRADPGPQNSPSSQQSSFMYIALDGRMGVSSIELFSSRNGSESCNENLKSELTLELYNSWRTVPRVPLAGFFPLRGVFQLAGGYFRGGRQIPPIFLAISRGGGNTPTSLHRAPCAPPQKNTATRPGRRTPLGSHSRRIMQLARYVCWKSPFGGWRDTPRSTGLQNNLLFVRLSRFFIGQQSQTSPPEPVQGPKIAQVHNKAAFCTSRSTNE